MLAKNSRLSSSTSRRRRSISALPSFVGERRPNSSTSRSSALMARCRSRSFSRGVCASGSAVTAFSLPFEFAACSASFAAAFNAFRRSRRLRSRSRTFSLFVTESVTERYLLSQLIEPVRPNRSHKFRARAPQARDLPSPRSTIRALLRYRRPESIQMQHGNGQGFE